MHIGIGIAPALAFSIFVSGCGSSETNTLSLTTGSFVAAAPAVQLASVRAHDAETAAQIASNGALLYNSDESKRDWKSYCHGARLLANQGNFRQAVREASKAFYLGEKQSGGSFAKAHAARDLAYAYSLAGDLDNAGQWAQAALRYARVSNSTRDTATVVGPVQKVIGDIELRRGQPAKAIAAYEEAIKLGDENFKSQALASMANAEIASRNFERARQLFREAEKGADPTLVSYIRRGEAELALAEGKLPEALQLFNTGATTADDYNRVWAFRGAAVAQKRLKQTKSAIESYKQALKVAGALRGKFHSEEFKTGFFGQLQTVYDEATELLVESGAIAEALEASEQGRARAMLDLIRGRVQVAGSGTGNAVVDPVGKAETAASIQATLADKQALVVYHSVADKTFVWTISKASLKVVTLKAGRGEIEKKVRRFRELIEKKSPGTTAAASELYTLLVAPAKIAEGESVVFVPHKSLHLLPFHALRGAKGWLVQERAVGTVPSASALVSLQMQRGAGQLSMLALGNPTSGGGDQPLPGAENEVRKISSIVKGSEAFFGKDATKARFMSRSPASNIIHIAAHSTVDDLDPLYSIVRLASSANGGGDLEAHEVYRMNLAATRMVVLSACDSGGGRISAGEEFWGFQRTFLGAGVRTLLLSHWPVYDDSTAQLMEHFYAHLQTDSPIGALRKAQLELMKTPRFADPVHWASFMVVGAPS
jgi:CHAT domain-containing protein